MRNVVARSRQHGGYHVNFSGILGIKETEAPPRARIQIRRTCHRNAGLGYDRQVIHATLGLRITLLATALADDRIVCIRLPLAQ